MQEREKPHLVGRHCGGLVAGQFVTTGTLTPMRFTAPGRQVTGHVAGLGTVGSGVCGDLTTTDYGWPATLAT